MMIRYLALAFLATLLAACQSIDHRTDLVSEATGTILTAGPGDTVMELRSSRSMPNVVGRADLFGRRVDSGRTMVRYLGAEGGSAVFERSDIVIESDETTMSHTPLIIPRVSSTNVSGTVGSTDFSGRASTTGVSVIGPRGVNAFATATAPVTIRLRAGQSTSVEGHKLTVVNVSAGMVEYRID